MMKNKMFLTLIFSGSMFFVNTGNAITEEECTAKCVARGHEDSCKSATDWTGYISTNGQCGCKGSCTVKPSRAK